MADRCHFEKKSQQKWPYLGNGFTDGHEIWLSGVPPFKILRPLVFIISV